MAKAVKEKEKFAKRKVRKVEILPLDPINYKILIGGVVVILLGYITLSMDPWDGFMALTVAPILLVLGYCVVIPIGIIYRKKQAESPVPGAEVPTQVPTQG